MSEIEAEQPTPKTLPLNLGAFSEQGLRSENQDSMATFVSPLGTVYLIADGMGGYRGGAEASQLITESFRESILAAAAGADCRQTLSNACQSANQKLIHQRASGPVELSSMGSTVVIAVISEHRAGLELVTAHVGDSRAYLQRGLALMLLTKDHTRVQRFIDTDLIETSAAKNHPESNVLTRAFGHTADLLIDISEPVSLITGDAILLCSDGLSGFASNTEINHVLQQYSDTAECARRLVRLAIDEGSNDNITVQIIRYGAG